MNRPPGIFGLAWLLALMLGTPVSAELSRELVLGKSRGVLGHVVEDRQFLTSDGGIVSLSDLRGRPLIVNPIFTSCHQICPALTSHLARMVDVAREAVGDDAFGVLTVGFDVDVDTPERMASFATNRGIDDPQWYFVGGDAATVRTFLDEIGFSYVPSPRGFDHLLQTTILDADGLVFRHVYGGNFDAPVLVEPLKELVLGRAGGPTSLQEWIDTVRLFCTVYDPDTGRYRFDYSVLIAAVVGGMCLMGIAVFLIRAWRETLRAET